MLAYNLEHVQSVMSLLYEVWVILKCKICRLFLEIAADPNNVLRARHGAFTERAADAVTKMEVCSKGVNLYFFPDLRSLVECL